jgi:hypothetical protein
VPLDADTAFLKSYSSFDAGYALCGGRKRLNVVRVALAFRIRFMRILIGHFDSSGLPQHFRLSSHHFERRAIRMRNLYFKL